MTNWLPTFPLLNRPPSPPDARDLLAQLDGWSIAELLRNERFTPAPDASLQPIPGMDGARAEPASNWQPNWLANAQWQAPQEVSWPEPPLSSRSAVSEDPFERAALRMKRSVFADARRRPPMGPPFLNEPPQDYPSHLGPIPQAPDWEEVVSSPTSWSLLKEPPRATDWARMTATIDEAVAAEEARRAWARRLGQWDRRGSQEYEPSPPPPPAEPSIAAEEARRAATMRVGQWRRRNQLPYEGYTAPPPAPPADDGDFGERARLNLLDSYYRGSLFGATRLALMKMLNESPDGGISPATQRVRDELRKEYHQILADLGRYESVPRYRNLPEFGTAALGRIGGGILSPESWIGLGAQGTTWLGRMAKAGFRQGAVNAGTDPIVQGLNVQAGVQDQYNPWRTVIAGGIGFVTGATAKGLAEALGHTLSDKISVAARLSGREMGEPIANLSYRDIARQYARENFAFNVVRNQETGFVIEMNMGGLRKATSGARPEPMWKLMPAIPDMLERGRYLGALMDNRARSSVKAIHVFESGAELEGSAHRTVLIVRETHGGKYFYDFVIDSAAKKFIRNLRQR